MTETRNNNRGAAGTHHYNASATQELFPRHPDLAMLRNMRILLVDDLPTNIILAQAILEHGGFSNVITAESGDKALNILEKQSRNGKCDIDIVLLDIILPGRNGYSVCRSMRQHPYWSYIPVIMITSDTKWKEETALAAFENGATDILFKPIRSAELLPRVISALSLKSERDNHLKKESELRKNLDEHAELEARLKYLVSHDELTGLHNRRRLKQALEMAVIYTSNYNRKCSLLYIDINTFKSINDSQGYIAGDRLLIELALLLKGFVGDEDVLARINADKFTILLNNCDEQAAKTVANTIIESVKAMGFTAKHSRLNINVTIGIYSIHQNEQKISGEIIALAEKACATAKESGYGVVCTSNKDATG
jgi:diguanylate cyclase (GGDEF)-like protein